MDLNTGTASATSFCKLNGQVIPCDQLPAVYQALFAFAPLFFLAVWAAAILLIIVPMWKLFEKAGKPGWAAIIPIYNIIVILEIIGEPTWWVLLFFIPFVNFIMVIILMAKFAAAFGKGAGFTVGLIVLPFIFYPILGFGKSQYVGSAAKSVV